MKTINYLQSVQNDKICWANAKFQLNFAATNFKKSVCINTCKFGGEVL